VRLFRLLSWPYLRRHRLRWALTLAGIVLGVAAFVAMNTANVSVQGAFSETVQKIAGRTQLQISAGEFGFDETVLERVQNVPEVGVAVPIIESTLDTGIPGQGALLVLGVDMTGDRSLRDYQLDSADDAVIDDPLVFLAQPDSIMVTREFADRNHLELNSKISLHTVDGDKQFTVRGVMRSTGMTQAFGGNLSIMDIYAAQAVFGRGRRIDRIDVMTRDGVTVEDCQKAVVAAIGRGYDVETPSSRGAHFASFMRSYTLITRISSVFALFVGMFIIYNAFAIAVTHRRAEIGILRALGATQGQIQKVFLVESAVAGLAGSILGAFVGVVGAQALAKRLGNVTQQFLGGAQGTNEIVIDPGLILAAVAMGIATSVLAAWIPARTAAGIDPVKALQKGKFQLLSAGENRTRRIGAAVLAGGSLLTLFLGSQKIAFYSGYLMMIVAGLLFCPTLTLLLARALRPVLRRILPAEGTLAADSLMQSPRRTSTTVAALMLSIAMTMGFSGGTYSLFNGIDEWMKTSLNPDFFVAPTTNIAVRTVTFPSELASGLGNIPNVRMVQLVRNARLIYQQTPLMLVAVESKKLRSTDRRTPLAGNIDEMYQRLSEGRGVIVSDAFQSNHKSKLGDIIELPAPDGILRLPVVGVLRDYADMQGSVFIDRDVYVQHWQDTSVNIARVYVNDGANSETMRERIRESISGKQTLVVLSNAEVRTYILELLSRWLSITRIQVIIAVLVAVLGIVNTLTVSIVDRRRELGVLQAVGGLRKQVRRTIWLEALSIAAIGLILGIALGALNIYYTIGMVQRDLGGANLEYAFPVSMALTLIPIILGAAWFAAYGPAEAAVRGSLVEALEYE
jgi:putative ABC transport system permease protein